MCTWHVKPYILLLHIYTNNNNYNNNNNDNKNDNDDDDDDDDDDDNLDVKSLHQWSTYRGTTRWRTTYTGEFAKVLIFQWQ